MRLPRQFDNPQTIPRRLRLDKDFLAPEESSRYIFIVSPIPSRKTGVFADVLLALLVKPLNLAVKLGRRGKGTPDPLVLDADLGARCRSPRSSDTLAFLRAGPKLMTRVSINNKVKREKGSPRYL